MVVHHRRRTEKYHGDSPSYRVIEPVDSQYRQVQVASALAAHCTSFSEFDRAQRASSVGQLLFPRAPWVMARFFTTTLICGTLLRTGAIIVFCT